MLAFHFFSVILSEDVVQFLLSDEAVAFGVDAADAKSYLLQSIIRSHNFDELPLRHGIPLFDIFVYSMPMEIAKVASLVNYLIFLRIKQLNGCIDLI